MSVLPVSSLMGKVMLIPSKLAIRSSVPQSWVKASMILGWLRAHVSSNLSSGLLANSRSDFPHKCFVAHRVPVIESSPELFRKHIFIISLQRDLWEVALRYTGGKVFPGPC